MHQPNSLSVLVVDDYPDSADATAQLIEVFGYTARAAGSCRAALEAVAAGFAPDVALLDLMLPDGDGYGLAGDLCRALARRPVLVAVSGLTGQEQRCRAAGFDHVLAKPAAPDELRALLDRYAGKG